jgi:hypothetical protein
VGPLEEHREQAHPARAEERLGPDDGDAPPVGAVLLGQLLGRGLGPAVGVDRLARVVLGRRYQRRQPVHGGRGHVHHAGHVATRRRREHGSGTVDDHRPDHLGRVARQRGGAVHDGRGAVEHAGQRVPVADVGDAVP